MPVNSQQSNLPLLKVDGLSLSFRSQERAVNQVSFTLSAGRTLGLVGASGAGKSSIARAILSLVKPAAGSILLTRPDSWRLIPGRRGVPFLLFHPWR